MDNLVFRGKDEKEQEGVKNLLEKERAEGAKLVENELEKTDNDLRIIEKVNDILGELFDKLGLPPPEGMDPDRVHFFDKEGLLKRADGNASTLAHYHPPKKEIDVNIGAIESDYKELAVILHEGIHYHSFQKFEKRDSIDEGPYAMPYRVGYHLTSEKWSLAEGGLKRFNEGLVDAMTHHLLLERREELESEFDILLKDFPEVADIPYGYYAKIIESICTQVAEFKGSTPEEVRDTLFRGEFTGEMMHLRDIEKVYGKEALRVLVALDNPDEELRHGVKQLVSKFFASSDPQERDLLKEKILSISDFNQDDYLSKREIKKLKAEVTEKVKKLEGVTDIDGMPAYEGFEEAALILSCESPFLNPNGTESLGSSEGFIDQMPAVPWIDLKARHDLWEYEEEYKIFETLKEKFNFEREDLEYVANEEGHPLWEVMRKEVSNPEMIDDFRYRIKTLVIEQNNLELIIDDFYKNEGKPKKEDERVRVQPSRRMTAWRIRNGSDEDYQADSSQMEAEEVAALAERVKRYQKEMKRFEDQLKRRYYM
jgi:hypothetical protein